MLKTRTAIAAIGISLCLLILSLPLVAADETTESFRIFTDKDEYIIGEAINIYAQAEAIDPNQTITIHDVIVYDSNNVSVAEWHNLSIVLDNTETVAYVGTFDATSEGEYTVAATATGCPWFLFAWWWFRCWFRHWRPHVVPELPFGTIAAIGAFVGATGIYVAKQKRKVKI